jgi:hypothetical protein
MHYPGQVRGMIPHEPVLFQLLSGNELKQAEQFMEDLKKNHRSEVIKLLSNLEKNDTKPKQSMNALTERLLSNSTYFTKYEIPGILNYTLDINTLNTVLKSASIRISPVGGNASRDFFPYSCAATLARKLGTEIVELPGHHAGFNTTHHKEFAERLHNILDGYQDKVF